MRYDSTESWRFVPRRQIASQTLLLRAVPADKGKQITANVTRNEIVLFCAWLLRHLPGDAFSQLFATGEGNDCRSPGNAQLQLRRLFENVGFLSRLAVRGMLPCDSFLNETSALSPILQQRCRTPYSRQLCHTGKCVVSSLANVVSGVAATVRV